MEAKNITVSVEQIQDAEKWFNHNDIDANVKDIGEGNSLYLNVGDDFNVEVSAREISYRAELWGELEVYCAECSMEVVADEQDNCPNCGVKVEMVN